MADFASPGFGHASYASNRPIYPSKLYELLLSYHGDGRRELAIDLGTGHGLVARALSPSFAQVLATDPSPGMLEQARPLSAAFPNIAFQSASAEDLHFVPDGGADMVVSGQAAHWFDQARWWSEMRRILRPGGTLAVWGYKDPVLIGWPQASKVLVEHAYGKGEQMLGDYWSQPGRSIVQNKYREILPPDGEWRDVRRLEYEPNAAGPRIGEGNLLLEKKLTVAGMLEYVRTWSSFHKWQETHPGAVKRSDGGKGDVVDEMFDAMRKAEDEWKQDPCWLEREVHLEYGTGLIMARKI